MSTRDHRINNRREQYIRRTAIVRKERGILILLCMLAFILSLLISTNRTNADNFKDVSDSIKLYKSITIYAGDTYESIAEEFMSDEYSSENKYINELMSINSMNPDTVLIPGNKIIVPYYMSKSISTDPVIEISLVQ